MDEALFIHDVIFGCKYRLQGERIVILYAGNCRWIVVYGAITRDGNHLLRMHELFDTPAIVGYPKVLQRHFGKAAAMMDRAPPHRANAVKKLLRENKNIRIMYPQKDPRTSTLLSNAGAKKSKFCSYQNIIECLLACAMSSLCIIRL